MKIKKTPHKKNASTVKAHRGRIVYEGRDRDRGRGRGGGRGGTPQLPSPGDGLGRFPGIGRGGRFPGIGFPGRGRGRGGRPSIPPFAGGPRTMPFPPRGGRRPTGDPRPPIRTQPLRPYIRRAFGNKGMYVTKKAIGHNDFRKGGLTLSVTNNLNSK